MTQPTQQRWAEIERVLDIALELGPGERAGVLAPLRTTDPELGAEVERLLAACEAAGSFLEEPAPVAAGPMVASVEAGETLQPGDRLGSYEIVRELGRGGMAVVYLARDHKHHRAVALKVLLPELAATLGADRFLREIRIAAGLTHPHILPLHDSGEAAGLLYYVMPYVEGQSLRARLEREGPLPLDEALQIARQVLAALGYAHAHGILHRDIKPENILLDSDHAVVADFGIARAVSAAGEATLTETGLAVGTPVYMSPEQARAEPQLDGRSDLYSLGCVLYEMLAGSPPFMGATPRAVIARHALDPLPSLRTVRPGVPEAVERTVARALAKVPADRFADAQQLASALTAALTEASPVPALARPGGARRQRRPMLLAAAALLLAIGGVVLARGGGRQASGTADGSRMLAILPFKNLGAPADQYFAEGLTEEITSRLAMIGDLGVISRASTDRYRGTDKSLKQVGQELGVGYVLEGSVRWDRRPDGTSRIRVTPQLIRVADDRHLWATRYDADLRDIFEIQASVAEQVATALGLVVAAPAPGGAAERPTTNLSAYDAYLRGNAAFPGDFYGNQGQILTRLQRAIENYREAVRFDSTFAVAYARLGSTAVTLYRDVADSSTAAEAKAAIDRALRLAPGLGEAHYARGLYHLFVEPDTADAFRDLEEAVRLRPNDADFLMELANTEWNLRGPGSQAITKAERAVQLDPRNQRRAVVLAFLYQEANRFDEAERAYDRAIALRPENPGPYTQKAVNYLIGYGDIARARRVLRQATPHVPDTMDLISAAATTLMPQHFLGMLDESWQRAALTLPVSAFADDTVTYGIVKGAISRALGDSVRFRAYFDTALTVAQARYRKNPDPAALFMMSFPLGARGQWKEAYDAFARGRAAIGPNLVLEEHEARLAVIAGDYERAIRILERKNWGRHLTVPWLRADPFWDPLRKDPRFQRLISPTRDQ
jgi:TolB-like protein/Flp pilus assembly protein TadD/tRNA A-37 threonylcarbamoyl transferase component Bud32